MLIRLDLANKPRLRPSYKLPFPQDPGGLEGLCHCLWGSSPIRPWSWILVYFLSQGYPQHLPDFPQASCLLTSMASLYSSQLASPNFCSPKLPRSWPVGTILAFPHLWPCLHFLVWPFLPSGCIPPFPPPQETQNTQRLLTRAPTNCTILSLSPFSPSGNQLQEDSHLTVAAGPIGSA